MEQSDCQSRTAIWRKKKEKQDQSFKEKNRKYNREWKKEEFNTF